MSIDTGVCDEPQKTLPSILQCREFNSQALDVIEGLFGKDLGFDIPVLTSVHCDGKVLENKRDTLTKAL
jgi:hypothetical protein